MISLTVWEGLGEQTLILDGKCLTFSGFKWKRHAKKLFETVGVTFRLIYTRSASISTQIGQKSFAKDPKSSTVSPDYLKIIC